ncbi:MAG: hypothetical protein D6732_17780 [Methanobacteriota archaeon]|nr:MAG: hypothetical protein D6732_17780 [Euryarchaeota archaeon]
MTKLKQQQFVIWILLSSATITLCDGFSGKIPISLSFSSLSIFLVGNFWILNRYFSLPDKYGMLFWNYLSTLAPIYFLISMYYPQDKNLLWIGALSVLVSWFILFKTTEADLRHNMIANSYFDFIRTYWGIVAVCYLTIAEILNWSFETGKNLVIGFNLLLALIILFFQAIPSRLHFVFTKFVFPTIVLEGIYLTLASFFFPSFGLRIYSLLALLIQALLHDHIWIGSRLKRRIKSEAVLGKGRFKRIFLKSSIILPSYFYVWESELPFIVYIPEFFQFLTNNEVDIFISLRKKVLPKWKPVIICENIDKDVKEHAERQGILVITPNFIESNTSGKK